MSYDQQVAIAVLVPCVFVGVCIGVMVAVELVKDWFNSRKGK